MVVSRWAPSASPLQTIGYRAAEAASGHLLVKAITITRSGLEKWRAYNLTVEGDHTYFVGTLNAWVHNADCLPKAGRWGNGTRGNADWYPDNPKVTAITGQDPIPFVDGYANFDKWARDTFDNLALPKTRTGDRNVGLEAVAQKYGLSPSGTVTQQRNAASQWLRQRQLVIHHPLGGTSLQLIPSVLNRYVKHRGGYGG